MATAAHLHSVRARLVSVFYAQAGRAPREFSILRRNFLRLSGQSYSRDYCLRQTVTPSRSGINTETIFRGINEPVKLLHAARVFIVGSAGVPLFRTKRVVGHEQSAALQLGNAARNASGIDACRRR